MTVADDPSFTAGQSRDAAHFAHAFRYARDIILLLDEDGKIFECNEAAITAYGYSREEFLLLNLRAIRAPESLATLAEDLKRATRPEGELIVTAHLRKDGRIFPVETSSRLLAIDGKRFYVSITRDITERRQGETALARSIRALRTLSASNRVVLHAEEESELLNQACRVTVEEGGYIMSWIGYAEGSPEKTLTPVAWAGIETSYLTGIDRGWADTAVGQGPLARAIRSREMILTRDISQDPNDILNRTRAVQRGYASNISFPLIVEGNVLGGMSIYASGVDAFDPEEIVLLKELANDLSFGIQSLRTRKDRDNMTYAHLHHEKILRDSFEQSIRAIAATIEKRDPYTAGHQTRVGQLAVAIARELGMEENAIHGIDLAASIHDLGKISIPAEILAKPGKINDIEFMLIKTHAQTGYDIVKNIKYPWPIAVMVLQHHERLDGSGYPLGLKDDAILMESRIMAVADVVEAMSSHRPYRAALGIDSALTEIERGSGSAFDTEVVAACLRLFREKQFAFVT